MNNKPRFQTISNNGPKPMYFVHIGQRFALPPPPDGFHYVRLPNNKLVRRMERRGIMQHSRPHTFMHKITNYRRELQQLMPKQGVHPRQKRAERRRRTEAQRAIGLSAAYGATLMAPSGVVVDQSLTDAVLRSGK